MGLGTTKQKQQLEKGTEQTNIITIRSQRKEDQSSAALYFLKNKFVAGLRSLNGL